ncbi:MAG: oligopeptidase A [Gammaproteobacteria bacterium]|nr:oligopeptidase A [Gammaproteobacteria bacterium]
MEKNPLLGLKGLPPFSAIQPAHIQPAIQTLLDQVRSWVKERLEREGDFTWENFVEPLSLLEDQINRAWSPVSHMNSVVNNDALREAYNACLPMLSEYSTEMGQNELLYAAYQVVMHRQEGLSQSQKKVLENALLDFRLSGVGLPDEQKVRYKDIAQKLSSLTSKFSENVLDATNHWQKLITDEEKLAGLPASALALAKQTASQREQEGWMLTLEFPSYLPVITYADDRDLRRELYEAFSTRASDCGPDDGRWDNSNIMEEILQLRTEQAQILGFENYAELSIEKKMAPSCEHVIAFLTDLADRSYPQAEGELKALQIFARETYGVEKLEAWDITYYSEKLRQHQYAITQEELKPYFPETRVLPGLFNVVERLYGMVISEVPDVDAWHPDVRFYEIHDQADNLRGQFYFDLYARPNKRGGAWMDVCASRIQTQNHKQTPVAYMVCNFSPPVDGKPAQFTHNEVETLFHEFGHGLHHLLTQIDHAEVSGINGVAWDAVELPSQFMENWCWEKEALDLIAGHVETGEPLPDELYRRMVAAKNFQSAMQMVRQLEFALFDFRIHQEFNGGGIDWTYAILDQVRTQVAVNKPPEFNRFAHSFSHIFAGGYAAGYYSYKWAEVLSADAFSLFEEKGIFDRETGQLFLENILEKGGSKDAMDLFVAFRGREPTVDALLKHTSINAK